jgi:hypothetical protein
MFEHGFLFEKLGSVSKLNEYENHWPNNLDGDAKVLSKKTDVYSKAPMYNKTITIYSTDSNNSTEFLHMIH